MRACISDNYSLIAKTHKLVYFQKELVYFSSNTSYRMFNILQKDKKNNSFKNSNHIFCNIAIVI